jgi:hypothetical protein
MKIRVEREVLSKRMPIAWQANRCDSKQAPHGRKGTIGRNHVSRSELLTVGETNANGVVVGIRNFLYGGRMHKARAPSNRKIQKLVVQLKSSNHRRILASILRKRDLGHSRRGRPERNCIDAIPAWSGTRVKVQLLQQPEGHGREAITATLVAREFGLVQQEDIQVVSSSLNRRSRSGWTSSNDD